ncbi:MAG: hypothetical protein ACFE75_12790 [Candidatus Hodarchaeota archaeon]
MIDKDKLFAFDSRKFLAPPNKSKELLFKELIELKQQNIEVAPSFQIKILPIIASK